MESQLHSGSQRAASRGTRGPAQSPLFLLFSKMAALLAQGRAGCGAWSGLEHVGSPSADGDCIEHSPFLPVQNAFVLISLVPGGTGAPSKVYQEFYFHLGLSSPIYLVVSLNPVLHTTDIFLI